MKRLAELVNDFPSKIVSRMNSGGAYYSSNILRLGQPKNRERLAGEVTQSIYFRGYELRFGFYDENKVWVKVEPYADVPRGYDIEALKEALNNPKLPNRSRRQSLSVNIFGNGDVSVDNDNIYVKYPFKGKSNSSETIFEGFWYKFRPILRVITESKAT